MTLRSALIVLIASLLFVTGYGQAVSDRERANLVGAVKTVRERSYHYMGATDTRKDDTSRSNLDTGDTVTYDVRGNEIERTMVSDFGELIGRQTQTFDTDGRLTETTFADPNGSVQEKLVYNYQAGRLTETLHYDSLGILRERTKRAYDVGGNVLEEVYFDPDIRRGKTVFSYDTNGNVNEMEFFLGDNTKAYAPVGPCLGAHRVTMTYDDKRRPVTKAVYEVDGKIKKNWTYVYDERGQFSEQTVDAVGSHHRYVYKYEYDGKGNWTKSTFVDESDDGMFDLMLKATGKTVPPDELKKAKDNAKITSVTTRLITYY